MRRADRLWLASIVLIGTMAHADARTTASTAFRISEPASGVFVHSGRPLPLDVPGHDDIANIGFIVGTRCVAVIDTGGSIEIGRALHAAIRQRTQLPICYVINTHAHVDHVLGNAAFKDDRPSFVGHAALGAALARSADFFMREYAGDFDQPPTRPQIIGPDQTVEQSMDLDLGQRHLLLRAWPKAHTDCDLSVYDVRTSTLWAGDLLFRERLPALDGSLKGWLAAIDQLTQMKARLAIPGHGPATHALRPALAAERRYLESLQRGVQRALADGKPMEQAIAEVGLDQKFHWLLWDEVHPRNVAHAYQELEWE